MVPVARVEINNHDEILYLALDGEKYKTVLNSTLERAIQTWAISINIL